jgi:hydroxyethylthiazole kinase
MIISPPFLPTRTSAQTEADWLDAAMNGWQPGSGSFPITGDSELWKGNHLLDWHGGLHMKAPNEEGRPLPVRAIADGTVVFVRKPTVVDVHDHNHPLNYGGGTTSDGVVVIRHDTEIGVDANDQPVEVRFYSVYVHLGSIEAKVQQGKPIYRKDMLGMAGHIYGEPNMIHFETCCDDGNLRKLVGRSSDPFDASVDGRRDVIFGEIYFRLPPGTQWYGEQPLPNSASASKAAPKPHHAPHTPAPPPLPPVPLSAVYTSTEELIVGLRYLSEAEDGGLHAGDAVLTTYTRTGEVVDGPTGAGGAQFVREAEGEYQLYKTATHIAEAYPENVQPIPAAVYELLRFGRVIGPDALHPDDVPHWRKVIYPGGMGWVNLNAENVRKFSEADFPPWAGWMLIDDDTDGDSRCNSEKLGHVVYRVTASAATHSADQAKTQIRADYAQDALSTVICKVPSEWDAATLEQRWSWLKVSSDANPQPMNDDEYSEFLAHARALCFPLLELGQAQVHFHPKEFICRFRRCGWLSLNEVAQFLPRKRGADAHHLAVLPWRTACARMGHFQIELCRAMRKYLITCADRQAHFLAQTFIETDLWSTMEEYGRAHQQRRKNGQLYWPAPAMEYYQAFYGRGVMQLTWAANYESYGTYRGFPAVAAGYTYQDPRITHSSLHYWTDPRDGHGNVVGRPKLWAARYDPDRVATNAFDACDSGAFYWISKATSRTGININEVADRGVSPESVGRVSVLVNGGGYGYFERQAYAVYVFGFRGDSVIYAPNTSFASTHGQTTRQVYVDFTPQRP